MVVLLFCRSDAEITGYALDAIYNVVSNEPSEEGNVFNFDSRQECVFENYFLQFLNQTICCRYSKE